MFTKPEKKQKNFLRLIVLSLFILTQQLALAASSGFIENMPQLKQDPDRPGAQIWQKPGVDRSAYDRIMFEPAEIFISPKSEYKGLNPTNLKKLTDSFMQAVRDVVEPEIAVVTKPGPGVLYLRVAFSNVKVAKKSRGLLGFTPIGLVAGAVAGPNVSLKDATLEVEMLDSVSGERLGVLIEKAPALKAGEELSWDSVTKTLVFYAERFKARMLKAK